MTADLASGSLHETLGRGRASCSGAGPGRSPRPPPRPRMPACSAIRTGDPLLVERRVIVDERRPAGSRRPNRATPADRYAPRGRSSRSRAGRRSEPRRTSWSALSREVASGRGRLVLDDRVAGRPDRDRGRLDRRDRAGRARRRTRADDGAPATEDLPYIAPGFVDVHVHGWGGHDAMGDHGRARRDGPPPAATRRDRRSCRRP